MVAHIFTLLLAHFSSKLVNYSWHSESWKNIGKWSKRRFHSKMSSFSKSSESLNFHCDLNNLPILTQKVPKEA